MRQNFDALLRLRDTFLNGLYSAPAASRRDGAGEVSAYLYKCTRERDYKPESCAFSASLAGSLKASADLA